jgi:NAD(P)H-hydrate epimerase
MSHDAAPFAEALYDVAALRQIEGRAAQRLGDLHELMQRAGQAAWRELLAHWPQAQRIAVACGPGNNGGDGYVLALHALEAGREVQVVRLQAHDPRGELAGRVARAYADAGGRVVEFDGRFPACDVAVDALFGIGLSREPDEAAATLIAAINAQPAVLARTGAALDRVGVLARTTLGVEAEDLATVTACAERLSAIDLSRWLGPRRRDSHKGSNGRVLCVGGEHGGGGAILLCAQAALRSGAGLVDVATRERHIASLLARLPEAMAHDVGDAHALQAALDRANAVAVGPGLGQQDWGLHLYERAVASGKPLLLDADALNLLATKPFALPADAIITPHPGEAARLLGTTTADVQRDRFAAARALSERYACVVVLKGAGSIVAAAHETPRVIAAGNPGMAVGGMGDVLSGVIAALRAQGMSAFDAASCGALLHAAAGDAAAHDGGERGLLPSDLMPWLRHFANPEAMR